MSEIPTYPDEQSIEQRIAAAEARGFAAGLERAARECDSESEDWRNLESDTKPGEWQREEVAASQCARLIRALITDRRCDLCDSDMGHHELCSRHPLQTAPARLDADKTAQPLTEIRAVVPAGKRIVQPYGVEQYVYQKTGATAPKLFDGNVHVTPGSTAVATPPRSEDQVRAEERERCARECDAERGSAAARNDGVGGQVAEWCAKHIRALGPAPVDDTAARQVCEDLRHVCGKCGFRWPERSAYDELVTKLAAAEDRVRVLEGALRDIVDAHNNHAGDSAMGHIARTALAKPLEHEPMCPCNKEGTLGAAFPHAYCQCAALAKKSEGT